MRGVERAIARTAAEPAQPEPAAGGGLLARHRILTGWIALVAVYFVWGSTYTAIAIGDRTIPPLFLTGGRYLVAGLILFPIAGRGTAPWRLPRRQWASTFVTGLLMLAGASGLVAIAERTVPEGIAALLIATVPIWALLIEAAVRRRWPHALVLLAIALGLAGVTVLLRPGGSAVVSPLGAGTLLLGAVLWAAGSVQSKSPSQPRSPFLASAMQMLSAGAFLLLVGAATGEVGQLRLDQVGWSGVLALAWLIGGGSLVAYSAYLIALRLLPLTLVSTYAFVNPLVAVLIGATFLGEPLNLQVGIAALCTVGAIVVMLLLPKRRPAREDSLRRSADREQ